MKTTIELEENDIFFLTTYLIRINEEVGSTINSADDEDKVTSNMKSINKAVADIKEMFKIEF